MIVEQQSLDQEDPLEKEMATIPVLLPGKSRGWRSLVGCGPWGHKELDMTKRLHFHFFFLRMPDALDYNWVKQ